MRNKQVISDKLDRIESELRKLNYTIGTNDRDTSYESLDRISSIISDINTLLKRETQE
jgi:hypothetical protein